MFLAHGPVSFLANEIIQKKKIKKLKSNHHILIVLASFFFGILPDFDLFVLSKFNIPGFAHHEVISHTPIFYIIIWIVLKLLVNPFYNLLNSETRKSLTKEFLNILTNTFLICTLAHLFADFLVTRVMLFYPLTDTQSTLLFWILEPNLFAGYFLSPILAIELIFISIFAFVVYKMFFKETTLLNILSKSFIAVTVLILPLSTYILLNTYNRSYLYDKEGNIQVDVDYDTLKDSLDLDVGNIGENNIVQAKKEDILKSTYDIINSNKWAGRKDSESPSSKLKYKLGAHDSYRIVVQAYYNIGLPLNPVLRDYAIKKDSFKSYNYEYNYSKLLFEYLKENNILDVVEENESLELESGKIFFLMDEDEKIINMGITLEGNELAVVTEKDECLQSHSLKEIKEIYKTSSEKILVQK